MTKPLSTEAAVHALRLLTSRSYSPSQAEQLMRDAGSREELLAHLFVDLRVLDALPAARDAFVLIGQLLSPPGAVAPVVKARVVAQQPLPREELIAVSSRFAEAPDAQSLKERLRRMHRKHEQR
jgi:hypothetical protein